MKLSRSIIAIIMLISVIIGFILRTIIRDVPFITFDTKIDISTLITAVSLIATIFIMPFIIDERATRRNNINSMAVADLDNVCAYVNKARDLYDSISSRKISNKQYTQILSVFKQIASSIYALSSEFERCNVLLNFKCEVIMNAYNPAYIACTDKLKNGKKLSTDDIQASQIALDNLFNKIKQYRYRIYK